LTKRVIRIVALCVLLAGIVLAVIYRDALDPDTLRRLIADNPGSPLFFIFLQVLASLFFIPRTVLGIAAGLVFGLVWGAVWSIVGALAGAAAGFGFARWMGAEGFLDALPHVGKIIERAEHGHWRSVAIVRLLPLPHSVVNTALAATKLTWRDYLIGSGTGMLPMTIAQVNIGASGGELFFGHGSWVLASFMIAAALAISLAVTHTASKWR
jgi:uncharacterized membrane protein YdjX (TVP38/TMEM64 family)